MFYLYFEIKEDSNSFIGTSLNRNYTDIVSIMYMYACTQIV